MGIRNALGNGVILLLLAANTATAASDEVACEALEQALASAAEITLHATPSLTYIEGLPAFCRLRGHGARQRPPIDVEGGYQLGAQRR